jgi:hypothetical protein
MLLSKVSEKIFLQSGTKSRGFASRALNIWLGCLLLCGKEAMVLAFKMHEPDFLYYKIHKTFFNSTVFNPNANSSFLWVLLHFHICIQYKAELKCKSNFIRSSALSCLYLDSKFCNFFDINKSN